MDKKTIVVGLALACALAAPARAETLLVGPGGVPASLTDALAKAQDGDVIQLLSGDYKGEAAVLPAKKLTLRGMGKRPVFHGDGKVAEGKAIWLVRGGEIRVENVEFRGARSPDADGAGIRLEAGRLEVVDAGFFDNEHAILTTNQADAELHVRDTVFAQAPKTVGGLAHLLYVGRIARFSVTGSRFHEGFEGHLIKSRARESRIEYNLIHDGAGGGASYEIDLPNGGRAWVVGNVIGQSPKTQNPVVIAYGSDGRAWEDSSLVLSHNTLVNEGWMPAWFLRVFRDRLPKSTTVTAVNNLVIGNGLFEWGASGDFQGNAWASRGTLVGANTMSFELAPGSGLRRKGVDPRNVGGRDLSPKAEFALPVGTRPLPPPAGWAPGAFQR
jgi:hypothetical protein